MTLTRAFVTVGLTTLVCGAVGTLLGYLVGTRAPTFYTGAYRYSGPIDPVDVGIGQGLTAGLFTGVTIGILVVAVVAFFEIRKAALEESRRFRERGERAEDVIAPLRSPNA